MHTYIEHRASKPTDVHFLHSSYHDSHVRETAETALRHLAGLQRIVSLLRQSGFTASQIHELYIWTYFMRECKQLASVFWLKLKLFAINAMFLAAQWKHFYLSATTDMSLPYSWKEHVYLLHEGNTHVSSSLMEGTHLSPSLLKISTCLSLINGTHMSPPYSWKEAHISHSRKEVHVCSLLMKGNASLSLIKGTYMSLPHKSYTHPLPPHS